MGNTLPLGAEPVKRVRRGMRVLVRSHRGGIRKATVSDYVTWFVPAAVYADIWVRYDSEPDREYGTKLENVYTLPEGV